VDPFPFCCVDTEMGLSKCIGLIALLGCSVPLESAAPARASGSGPIGVFREVTIGAILPRATASTYTLYRDGDRASVVVATQTGSDGATLPEGITGWGDAESRTYSGSARELGGTLELDLRDATDRLDLVCTRKQESVAPATAVRVRTDTVGGDCGDRGAWSPGATSSVVVLACNRRPAAPTEPPPPAPTDPDEARWEREIAAEEALRSQLSFGEGPGIEYLYVNDDCIIQGGGLRFIPADGSVANVRGPRD
jgi:hypothetical protein